MPDRTRVEDGGLGGGCGSLEVRLTLLKMRMNVNELKPEMLTLYYLPRGCGCSRDATAEMEHCGLNEMMLSILVAEMCEKTSKPPGVCWDEERPSDEADVLEVGEACIEH